MSLRTPILTVVCACAVPHMRATVSAARPMCRFIEVFLPWSGAMTAVYSHSQVVVKLFDVGVQFGIGEPVDHPAVFHHIVPVRHRGGEPEVLLDQQNGK